MTRKKIRGHKSHRTGAAEVQDTRLDYRDAGVRNRRENLGVFNTRSPFKDLSGGGPDSSVP